MTVQEVLNLFNFDDEFQFWKMKTKINGILANFYSKYNAITPGLKNNVCVVFVKEDGRKVLKCNDANVTPYSGFDDKNASKSAFRQYLDVLCSFKILKPLDPEEMAFEVFDKRIGELNYKELESNLVNEIFENIFNSGPKVKKFFYSSLVCYLSDKYQEDEEIEVKVRGGKREIIDRKEMVALRKACGYDMFYNNFDKYGLNLEDIYQFILTEISKKSN